MRLARVEINYFFLRLLLTSFCRWIRTCHITFGLKRNAAMMLTHTRSIKADIIAAMLTGWSLFTNGKWDRRQNTLLRSLELIRLMPSQGEVPEVRPN